MKTKCIRTDKIQVNNLKNEKKIQRKDKDLWSLETRHLRKINGITIGFGTIEGPERNYEVKGLCWMKSIPEHVTVSESTWYRQWQTRDFSPVSSYSTTPSIRHFESYKVPNIQFNH